MTRTALLACAALLASSASAQAAAPTRPWDDRALPPERRASLLEAQMTDAERFSLLHGVMPIFMKVKPPGALQSAGFFPGVPRLGVPPLLESDASLGVANAGRVDDDATSLPSGLSLASSFDPETAYAGGAMIGKETRQKGFDILLAGGVNLVRDPRNGRNFEYLGEDPLLAGRLAGRSIAGIQSNHVVSTTKHFVLNGQETGRQVLNAVIDPAALRESDLLAFELAVEGGRPGSAMCAYNKINGVYACENAATLGALKHDWNWPGWVMSDWGAVHSVASANAGLDQESGQQLDKEVYFDAPLKAALASGRVSQARFHDMVRRVLWGLFSTGVMDDPPAAGGLDTAADAPVTERAGERGIVLLKNEGGLLPLAAGARRIALIGGHADLGVISGGGSSQVIPKGSHKFPAPPGAPAWGGGVVFQPSAPLDAIRRRAAGAQVSFDPGTDPKAAAAAARGADVAVVFATQWATEGQDVPLQLRDDQDALIAAVAAANPHTVVVLETGNPVFMPWLDRVPAVMEAWYPGSSGGEAIARVLYGEVDAQGRLPISFPRTEAELPRPTIPGADVAKGESLDPRAPPPPSFDVPYPEGADVGYRWYEKTGRRPLFPFGYGLSYTSFRYGGLSVAGGRALQVSFDVTNTGRRAGEDTPQVYAAPPGGTARLIGWGKVALKPGETRRVTVAADPRLLAAFDAGADGWRLNAGAYRVTVGAHAGDAKLEGSAQLDAQRIKP